MDRCPVCQEADLKPARVRERLFGVELGEFDGEECPACGETFLDEEAMAAIERKAREAGVWGLGKTLKVARSGNSLVIRIPADMARYLHLEAGTEVYVHPEGDDRLVMET